MRDLMGYGVIEYTPNRQCCYYLHYLLSTHLTDNANNIYIIYYLHT